MIKPPLDRDFWVFGYGSLMWNPGFPFVEKAAGQIHGHHRRLCVLSTIYRGTPDKPGLVLGLDQGGSCCGRAFRVAPEHVNETLKYLDEREQVTKVYCPYFLDVKLSDGRDISGYTFVVRREHEQYVHLDLEQQARLVAQGSGKKGSALDYLCSTIEHIDELGIHDRHLHDVLEMARSLKNMR